MRKQITENNMIKLTIFYLVMSKNNRCDFTAIISLNGQAHLLVVEVKGQ